MPAAWISGGGSGLGRWACLEFLKQGWQVAACSRRLDNLKETSALSGNHPGFFYQSTDITDASDIKNFCSKALKQFQKVDVLIMNAGELGEVKYIAASDDEKWIQTINTNLISVYRFIKEALPYLKKSSDPRILLISSGAAVKAAAGWSSYCVSKAALEMLGRCTAEELAESKVQVLSFAPGVIDTAMQDKVRQSDPLHFPRLSYFVDLKNKGQLLSPEIPAKALFYLATQKDVFYKGEHLDIRDENFKNQFKNY